ncbi:ECF transporter S component [Nocardioides sp. zg-ZUI104]|uniref:ECF transporter S component n=1 Tax=Nocardioides faecalis TaxID=2803858 RepID=UPI001BCCD1EB|nr:ECF transporter S component [Nocardioides faecalis]MBS4752764.1 ECF transporter S component [Nocardioides faecalis]
MGADVGVERALEGPWAALKGELRAFREEAGSPSYGVIAERICAARIARGQDAYAARIGRTTVYDVFMADHRRINLELVREIGAALGAPEDLVQEWIDASRRSPVRAEPAGGEASYGEGEEPAPAVEPAQAETPVARCDMPAGPSPRQVLLLLTVCLGLNHLGSWITDVMPVQLYLDMTGTAIAAIALGPWRGAALGYFTVIGTYALGHGTEALYFGLVQVAGALAWGYGVRWGAGRTVGRYLSLNIGVAALSTAIAAPLITFLFAGTTRHGTDALYEYIQATGSTLFTSVVTANLLTSVLDKILSGSVALVVLAVLPAVFRCRLPLAAALHDASQSGSSQPGDDPGGPR